MLAMKIRGHRNIDLEDAEVLIRRLKLTNTRAIQRIADDAYEGHGDDNRTMIQEGLKRIAKTMPDLTVNHVTGAGGPRLRPPTLHQADRDPGARNAATPQRPSTETTGLGTATRKTPKRNDYPR